ncbi:MAG: NFACT RNA binding domain-containing protein [Candidatus Acidifodinimicrobium sp.]
MKREITFLDAFKLVNELSYLQDGKVRDVKSKKNELFLMIYSGREYWLRIVPGRFFSVQFNKPDEIIKFPFTSKLKDTLTNKNIKFSLHRSDRILDIQIGDYLLIAEIFSNGNIALTKDKKIIWSMFARKYGTREIKSGQEYIYPPEKIDVTKLAYADFKDAVLRSEKENIVKCLAVDLSLGGVYSEEIVFRARINKSVKPGNTTEEELNRLYNELRRIMFDEVRPNIINKEVLSVIELKHLDGEKVYFDTINEAVKSFFSEEKNDVSQSKKEEEISKAIEQYKQNVKFIEENFDKISKMISTARDSSVPIDRRKGEIEKLGFTFDKKYLISEPNKDIIIDITQPLRYQLEKIYNKIKAANSQIKRKENKTQLIKAKIKKEDKWYSKYIWFFTSGGILGILGKNNDQNVSIVRKYSAQGDIVLHADIFGSPFCVLKREDKKDITEEDIKEGANMTASYSSAWKANASNIDVYYVDPSQVTLSPPPGEYLTKGSFYISGKRNYLNKVELKVYFNVHLDKDGVELNVSPTNKSEIYFLLKPGNTSRKAAISLIRKQIAEKTGYDIPADEIDKRLPSGGLEIVESQVILK